ncbi:Nuclear pore complex protein NUP50A [Heracleum sosnowskyi]|uniref:Nuclear pore complex protein NUP50A n=1 Tax=Heracleum sosnowskyi TaxID=360622 RepID=A0AAD8H9F8_9APIA|nr:Nuclear pore complex protein NUP50A [Heracleum sosnowskyi]
MGDAENALPSSKKRIAGRQLTKETLGVDDDEENSEQETGTFKKASDDVLASRRIVKVRRQQPSAATSAASNPFAAIRLVPPTNSTVTPAVVTSAGKSVNPVSEDTEVKNGVNQETEKEKDEGDKTLESNVVLVKNGVNQETEKGKVEEAGTESTVEDEKTKAEGKVEDDKISQCSVDEPQSADEPKAESMVTKEKNNTVTETSKAESTEVKTQGVDDTKHEAKANADDNKTETEKTDNGVNVDVQKDGANPFSSFKQLSSNQNAFTGVAGSGFSSSTFSFGPISKDGSTVDSGFSKSSFLSNLGASVANKGEGSRIMQEVTVETGEENEKSVFAADSVLFEFLDGGWKERGKGEIKVNVSSIGTGKARLVMRARGNYRLILNAGLYSEMKLTAMEKKGVTFACMNSNGEGMKDGLSTFALKFKDPSIAEEFRAVVTEHKGKTTTTGLKTPENSS